MSSMIAYLEHTLYSYAGATHVLSTTYVFA